MPPSSPMTVGMTVATMLWSRAATKLPVITTARPMTCSRLSEPNLIVTSGPIETSARLESCHSLVDSFERRTLRRTRIVPSGSRARRVIAVDDNAVRLENTPFLARDLGRHAFVIAPTRVRLPELRRSEEAAVLHAIERRVGQEVERAGPPEIDTVMLEPLALEVTRVERDRFRAELQRQAREPRLEQRGALARRGRPARVR